MLKSSESININGENEKKLRTCANNYARVVRQRTFHQKTVQGDVSTWSSFLRNKQQDDWDNPGVKQSKTMIKPAFLIQLKVTQNEKKNKLKLNSLTSLSHPVKKEKNKDAQPNFTNTDVPCLNTAYLFLVARTSRFVRCIKTDPKLWS